MRSGEWQTVTKGRRKKGASRRQDDRLLSSVLEQLTLEDKVYQQQAQDARTQQQRKVKSATDLKCRELCETDFHRQFMETMAKSLATVTDDGKTTSAVDVVSYGIGKFGSSAVAQYQLALLLLLRTSIPKDAVGSVYMFDPMLSQLEKDSATGLGVNIIPANEQGKRCVERPTIFFMPHCGQTLYNNVIWANWSCLSRIVIVGNSFGKFCCDSDKKQSPFANLAAIRDYTVERAVETLDSKVGVFNDTSVHTFDRPSSLQRPPEHFVKVGENSDPEII